MESGAESTRRQPTARFDVETVATVAATLSALASPSRLLILAQLRHGPLTVTTLAQTIGKPQPSTSQHLGLLRAAGLVSSTRRGRAVIYSLVGDHVIELLDEVVHYSERVRASMPPGQDLSDRPIHRNRLDDSQPVRRVLRRK
ncbi:ArsR/SmtB family transcription factor [Amycolatopsis plumensis]|uniref:ArsR/SmtB family transcription factor n=1 Tax=Amycolatopsis plumensis TaxID=236508 RepID=A0ABV5UIX4_9PSEU